MNDQPMSQLEREKAVFKYSLALEQGDLDALGEVLVLAENDLVLGQLIVEVNEVYRTEFDQSSHAEAQTLVRQLLREHIPSAFSDDEELPPLTVGDVVAKMQAEAAQRGAARNEVLAIARQLQNNPAPLPFPLRLSDIKRLLNQLGVAANAQFEKLFQDVATFLSMGRGQSLMAATRRQKSVSRSKPSESKP